MQIDFITFCFAITRAIHFFACLLILGVWVFDRIVIAGIDHGWRRIAGRLLLVALPMALISGVAWFGFVAIAMSGLPAADALKSSVLKAVLWQTYFGQVWKWRAMFWAWSAIALVVRTTHSTRAWVSLSAGIFLVASLAFSGHGQTGLSQGWHLLADMLHLLIASAWPIGLLPFGLVLWRIRRSSDPPRWTCAAQLTQRFSTMSLVAVALLGASGIVNAWCLLGSFSALISTSYGRMLMLKIIFFVIMMMLAAMNRLILKPRLISQTKQSSQTAARLQICTAIEFILAILILIITGVLGTLPPAQM